MSKKAATESEGDKKSKGKLGLILVAVGMLAVGGGGAFALVATGVIGGGKHEVKEDNRPKLVRKGEADPFMPKQEGGEGEGGGGEEPEGEGGDPYRTAYYTFTDDFTSNLKESDALLQLSLACSTRYDGRVLQWIKKHELAIRSALLAIMADTPEDDIYTIEGKGRLQKRMTDAINRVLIQKEGVGGVDNVYFRNFIIQ
ncbi:flagellar basal body-associated protein FliL [Novosphingobium sp. KA1]|uniref:flagellar basal body-associated FliL family protein n=1 Tax=Novosphingobium sp. (strain KA1) TaxID=164608 RepID=UPI001AF84BD3|nr:flagellar basal body-associated FliL family protein [Novosphingobium sp. KA1]QSR16586.1 flagellar basal body-associated protein FliL [Novosphingobium sp. KA1]